MRGKHTDSITWNEDTVSLLRKLHAEGLSSSQIAAQIPHATRNAIISKAHRLKLNKEYRPVKFRKTRSDAGERHALVKEVSQLPPPRRSGSWGGAAGLPPSTSSRPGGIT